MSIMVGDGLARGIEKTGAARERPWAGKEDVSSLFLKGSVIRSVWEAGTLVFGARRTAQGPRGQ